MTELTARASVTVTEQRRASNDPRERLARLLDPGTLNVVSNPAGSRVTVARGRINDIAVIAYCTDARSLGGAIGSPGARQIADAIDSAVVDHIPVVGLWHSGGASLGDGVEALDGIGQMFAAMIAASGRVPQVSVVLGPAAGGAAYGPALTDVIVMAPEGRVFVTGPDVVRQVTGEQIDMAGLGGSDAHGRRSGVVHVNAQSETDAYARARRITTLLARPGTFDTAEADGDARDPGSLLPDRPRRAYDIRPVVRAILDDPAQRPNATETTGAAEDDYEELQPRWAPNVVVALGRLTGRTVGVIANNPLRKGGCLDSLAAEKAARFVRMCDSFGIPLVVLVDVPGYLPGVSQEWGGVVRRGAKLLYAFSEAVVPRVTVVLRKSYGGAYIAMNSRSLGATSVLAWPQAEVAVMGAEAAVGILHRRALAAAAADERDALRAELVDRHTREAGGLQRGVSLGVINKIIDSVDTRREIVRVLAAAPGRQGIHGNIPL
ncbi:acyl-CoA carboxylase subunit beta [Frankia sp. CNm7]|uniref:Acyl-CoA carboxylase subunit beta n=1 Tax=Frankia nepalensis TaxID=1836974 RepID=A0A937UQI5_9ACTN|nr:carboxyl transferase domain-containing protein [Frankia nepalensis]MBL7502791.1 acyl-CoA carboxylase subunit beta [Frankia nepalensis]MBL7512721.1 acyl-CoA carboxylase subunit beta [Frankia nepalensis]MBL7524422.1 acyl-CoA carboxylase subunit beta [Frankia nepalensis]MBL7628290.1 acyl-CoA carboxylase subunit beta [Frankia nepalensis]